MLDVLIEYEDLINGKITEHKLKDHNSLIHSYTINDFEKLWNDGNSLYTLFQARTKKIFSLYLSMEFDDELKYFKYNNTVYAINYNKSTKLIFS